MGPTILVDMAVFKLFRGRLAQPYHLDIEVQLIPGQWMIKIQRHVIALDGVDARIT